MSDDDDKIDWTELGMVAVAVIATAAVVVAIIYVIGLIQIHT